MPRTREPGSPHWTQAGTLLLAISPDHWPPPRCGLRLDGIEFEPKRELHATIVGRRLGQDLRAAMARDPGLAPRIDALCASLDWLWTRLRRWWLLRKRDGDADKASIVEAMAMPAMRDFHARLGALLGRRLPVPPPHVTLYVAGDAEGIGVPDEDAWRSYAVREVAEAELRGRGPSPP